MTLTHEQQLAIARKQRATRIEDLERRRTRVGEMILAVEALGSDHLVFARIELDNYYSLLTDQLEGLRDD